jgi:RNA polymerase sigma-70 factor, ECF subfamily
METRLADALLGVAPDPACDRRRLEQFLVAAVERATSAYPEICLPACAFARFVGARLGQEGSALEALARLRLDDLFLACASERGDRGAIAAVERECFGEIRSAVGRWGGQDAVAAEITQMLRERLFVGTPDRPPRIAEYGGRAALRRWIHAIASRAAIDLQRRAGKDVSADDALLDHAVPENDPEIELLKRRYSADFKDAVREALAALGYEARNDLRFYYIDGLNLDELAALHRVSASAVSRRLGKARRAVLERTRAILAERLHIGDEDVLSILRLIGSRLELGPSVLAAPTNRER